jgi:hypothetical protein
MERPCYRCETPVDENIPFCPSCGAPQIRVTVPEAVQPANVPATAPLEPGTPASIPPPAIPMHFAPPGKIQWGRFLRVALPLALLSGGIAVPLFPLGFLLLIGTVVFSIRRYRLLHGSLITGSIGARLGAVVGFFAYLPFAILLVVELLLPAGRQILLQQVQQKAVQDARYQELMQWIGTPQGFTVLIIFMLIMFLALFLIMATVTGMLTATLGKRES